MNAKLKKTPPKPVRQKNPLNNKKKVAVKTKPARSPKSKAAAGSIPHVSVITIFGNICSFKKKKHEINSAFNQPNLKAVCLKINSPGGSPVQSHLIAEYIRSKAKSHQVPVYCFIEENAASGGYMVACAASMIFVTRFSIVGGLGKLEGNPLTQTTKEEEIYKRTLLSDSHQEFINNVKESRDEKLVLDESEVLFSCAVFGALKAIQLGIVDGLYTVLEDKVGELIGNSKFKLVEIGN